MINETKMLLWRTSVGFLGMALPSVLLGRGIMFGLIIAGVLLGLMATHDASLRGTMKLFKESLVVKLAGAALVALLLSGMFGIVPDTSMDKWGQIVAMVVGAVGVFVVLREMPGVMLELLLKVLVIGTLAMAGIGLIDALVDEPRLSAAIHGMNYEMSGDRLQFISAALAVLLPFVWGRLMIKAREYEPFARRIAVPVVAVSLAAALVCGGLAGWLGILASGGVFMLFATRWHGLVLHRRHWVVVGLTLVFTLLAYGVAENRMPGGKAVLVNVQRMPAKAEAVVLERLELWQETATHVLDNPLTGVGPHAFRYIPELAGFSETHPHNWLLQLLVETGLVGTVAVLALLVLVMRRFAQYAPGNVYAISALASLTGFLVTGFVGNDSLFSMWWLSFVVFAALLGWRAGWGGAELANLRRMRVVKRRDLIPYGKRK